MREPTEGDFIRLTDVSSEAGDQVSDEDLAYLTDYNAVTSDGNDEPDITDDLPASVSEEAPEADVDDKPPTSTLFVPSRLILPQQGHYRDALSKALDNAIPQIMDHRKTTTRIDDNGDVTLINEVDPIKDMPDDQIIYVNENWQTPANAVRVDSPEELEELIRAAMEVAQFKDINPEDIKRFVQHEEQHAEASRALGVSNHFEVAMAKVALSQADFLSGRFSPGFQPASIDTDALIPKIAAAATAARPENPSASDLNIVTKMGYRDIQDLGDRIKIYLRGKDAVQGILLPKSYQDT